MWSFAPLEMQLHGAGSFGQGRDSLGCLGSMKFLRVDNPKPWPKASWPCGRAAVKVEIKVLSSRNTTFRSSSLGPAVLKAPLTLALQALSFSSQTPPRTLEVHLVLRLQFMKMPT